jgi:hypothetical protein
MVNAVTMARELARAANDPFRGDFRRPAATDSYGISARGPGRREHEPFRSPRSGQGVPVSGRRHRMWSRWRHSEPLWRLPRNVGSPHNRDEIRTGYWSYRLRSLMARTLRCNIEDLSRWHPWFFLEPQIVACAAVLAPYGRPPAVFDVDCFNVESSWLGDAARFRLEVAWSSETADKADRLRATVQAKPLVEMAATALALVIVHHVVHLGRLAVTQYGDRTDYRSTRISCMLEVSGTETRSELGRRHRQKVAQAARNPFG